MSGKSLEEVHSSIDTGIKKGYWRKLFAFIGPAYLISVGYMDPGNWATDIAGGSQFGYRLIWVLLMSNLMALLLQSLSARLGVVRKLDLAQASRETYPRVINLFLYLLAEIAIIACDLAEVIGMALGLQLLFGIPLIIGVVITMIDTFLLIFLINRGMRVMEAFIFALIVVIGLAFMAEMVLARPDIISIGKGLIPSIPNDTALYITIGIIGATVMPHNLYLHSALVQTRKFGRDRKSIREALRFNFIDSAVALNLALLVNAAILILAASTFFKNGMYEVAEIKDAHRFLEPLLGSKFAPILFAVALIAAGQSSTITGTLAGQIIMEGYLNIRIKPWVRRIITRLLAVVPACLVIILMGEDAINELLVLSQVVLSLQLGFAIVPLIHFVSDRQKMEGFHIKTVTRVFSWITVAVIVLLNARLVYDEMAGWLGDSTHPFLLGLLLIPLCTGAALLLLYIILKPLFVRIGQKLQHSPHRKFEAINPVPISSYKRIVLALDFSDIDAQVINSAIAIGGTKAAYFMVHVVETPGALLFGADIRDLETLEDSKTLASYAKKLSDSGYVVETRIGFNSPKKVIPGYVSEVNADLLVMGSHGHGAFKDLILGTTISKVRHQVKVPVLVVTGL